MKILYVLLCVVVPVLWGLLVNWFFHRPSSVRTNKPPEKQEEQRFLEYQI